MKEITIDIPLDYNKEKTTVSVNGVKGKTCKELTTRIESALGSVSKVTATAEMQLPPQKVAAKVQARKL